jgi:DNA-binding CsgD family transcriptional regulator
MEQARRIIKMGHEASEIADPVARRQHLAHGVRQLVGAALVLVATDDDVRVGARGTVVASAVDNFDERVLPAINVMRERGAVFNPAIASMHSAVLTIARGQQTVRGLDELVDARAWRRCDFYQQFMRPAGIDHGLYSALRVNDSTADVLACWRETKDRPFDEEERSEIDLLFLEFGHLWRRQSHAEPWPGPLAPRYRRAFDLLLTGMSEKQIAAELGLTWSSLHSYVKALYRMLDVSSRAELMAQAIKRSGRA